MIQFFCRLADMARHRARKRRWALHQASGRHGEDLAHRLLRRQGLTVVARNYRARASSGEIDLIAWEGETLVFVEVKSRLSEEFGTPDRAVDHEKRASLIRSAHEYVRRAGVPWDRIRFDIVNVVFCDPPSVTHLKDVFRPRPAV